MRRVLSLLSAGGLALLLCPLLARPDSIPTVTATSVTYSHQDNHNRWSISGYSFSVGGEGATITIDGFAMPGQVLATSEFDTFSETIGSHGFTEGGLTLNGVSYPVALPHKPCSKNKYRLYRRE